MIIWPAKAKLVFKTIASLVACVFLWQQVSWAGDLVNNSIDKLDAEQSQTFAPAYLQNQQALHFARPSAVHDRPQAYRPRVPMGRRAGSLSLALPQPFDQRLTQQR